MSDNPYAYNAMMHDLSLKNGQYVFANQLRGEKKKFEDFEYNRPENILARQQAAAQAAAKQKAQAAAKQQAQVAAQQEQQQYENDTKYPQVQGGPPLGGLSRFFGGRRKYNKLPRHINKTRRSGKSPRKSRRLYKSKRRRS